MGSGAADRSVSRAAIVAETLAWLGTPYVHSAGIKGQGVDCARLLVEVYADLGLIERPDLGNYPVEWHLHRGEERYMGHLINYARRIECNPEPGDIALYKFGRCYSHGGIVVDDAGTVVHSYVGRGVISTRLNEEPLYGRVPIYWSLFI